MVLQKKKIICLQQQQQKLYYKYKKNYSIRIISKMN